MAVLDRKDAWTADDCARVAKAFLGVVQAEGKDDLDAEALFNAGVAYERCGRDEDAGPQFERALAIKVDFHPAKVHLILWRHRKSGGKDIDQSIAEMRQAAVVDARYQNVEALVALAMLSLERGKDVADTDGLNDRARAVRYLQSALAVDDGYSPAMNGLALYYLDEARASSGRKIARVSAGAAGASSARGTQAMELAALVCSQAIQKDPSDAVIHNTYGLIQVELGNLGKAAEAFGKARALRPGFYEAEMNFAAVNLQFRGFSRAEEAYRAVLSKRPADYDARIGLSLALRGQIQPDNADTLVEQATSELEKAVKLAPARPEAYYNEAILIQEYRARGEGPANKKALDAARALFPRVHE
jgi:tetratricopeptide (TPR) repeat protein